MKASKIQLTSIEDASRRFDPSYHLSDAIVVKKDYCKIPVSAFEIKRGVFRYIQWRTLQTSIRIKPKAWI